MGWGWVGCNRVGWGRVWQGRVGVVWVGWVGKV